MRANLVHGFVLGLVQLLFLLGAVVPEASAQTQRRAPTFLALPDEFPDVDARAVIIREPNRDVVLLRPSDASVETLAMAMQLLEQLRRRYPSPAQGQMVPITGFAVTTPPGGKLHRRFEHALSRLASAEWSRVGNLGWGRWIRF